MRKILDGLIVLGLLVSLIVAGCRVLPDLLPRLTSPSQPTPAPAPTPIIPRKPWLPWREVPSGLIEIVKEDLPFGSWSLRYERPMTAERWNSGDFDWARSPAEAKVGGSVSPDGQEEIQCDLPGGLHMRNTGGIGPRGPGSGAGLCVFTSIEHSAIHQNVPELLGFQKWMTTRPGGGYPEKVDKMISAFCKEKGVPVPRYLQVEGGDMEILKLACKTGRMPGVTYCWSPTGRYGGSKIAHMVNTPHASDEWVCVLDNNYPGEDRYEWMSWSEFRKTFMGNGGGWAVILLSPGPPPVPTN